MSQDIFVAAAPTPERPLLLTEFEGEVRDGILTIRTFEGDVDAVDGAVREQALSVIAEDRNGTRGTAVAADRFEFAVESLGATFEGEQLGQINDGCGPGVRSSNFAVTVRSFQSNGLAGAYAQITEIVSAGAPAPQFALCNSDAPSPNVFVDGSAVPVDDTLGLIRYGNLRPDLDGPATAPSNLAPGSDSTAATMVWKFRDGSFTFRGRLVGFRCDSSQCTPGDGTGLGPNAPLTQPDFWEPVGTVRAVAEGENVLYVGGDFSTVAARTGRTAIYDLAKATGADEPVRPFGSIENSVARAIVADGAGGYYVGAQGTFILGSTNTQSRVAHVLADGSIDLGFVVDVDNRIDALALSGGFLAIGGRFDNVNGVPRGRLAVVDAGTGALVGVDPALDNNALALVIDGTRLYVGGQFLNAQGLPRSRFAAFNLATGLIDPLTLSIGNGSVQALALGATGRLYTGGSFTTPASRVALWNTTTGAQIATFVAATSQTVRALAFRAGAQPALFIGSGVTGTGAFTVNGVTKNGFAAVNVNTGAVFNLNPQVAGLVQALVLDGNNVVAGGNFLNASGQPRDRLAIYNVANPFLAVLQLFDSPATGNVNALAIDATRRLYVAGSTSHMGGRRRSGLAALDLATGTPTAFDPQVLGEVRGIAVDTNGDVYFAGILGAVNSIVNRVGAAAVDVDGVVTAFDPQLDFDGAETILLDDDDVLLGGAFTSVGGAGVAHLARVTKSTGAVDPAFTIAINDDVRTLGLGTVPSVTPGATIAELYVGGTFTTPGSRLVVLDPATGGLIRSIGANGNVNGLAVTPEDLVVVGAFTTLAGSAAGGVGSVERATGAFRWGVTLGGSLAVGNAVAAAGNHAYVVGDFEQVNGVNRVRATSINLRTGARDSGFDEWRPIFQNRPGALAAVAIAAETVVVGGDLDPANFERGVSVATTGVSVNQPRVERTTLVGVHAN